jgi:hypothetical protein
LVEVSITEEKTIKGITAGPPFCWNYTDETSCGEAGCVWSDGNCVKPEKTESLHTRTYYASGWIKFNRDIDVGKTTPVVDFEIELSTEDPYYWEYQVINRTINEPYNFYVKRTSKNTYEITCDEVNLRTIARLPAPYYSVDSVIPWTFKATITV